MLHNESKRIYIFHNDFRAETYVSRNPGESMNDRNDRGMNPMKSVKGVNE